MVKGVKKVPKLKKMHANRKKMRNCRVKDGERVVGGGQGLGGVMGGVEGGVGGG